jgi:surface antigen
MFREERSSSMRNIRNLTILAMMLSLAGCQQSYQKQPHGTLLTPENAPIGSPEEARNRSAAETQSDIAGAAFKGKMASSLNRKDVELMQQCTQQALSLTAAGKKSKWKNPASGIEGSVTPQRRFTNKDGLTCREYQQTVASEGKISTGYKTACRQPDGLWKIVGR